MFSERFGVLRSELLRGGVSSRYVARTLLEIEEHFEDLEAAGLSAGLSAEEAARQASEALGDQRAIAAAVIAREELRDWQVRWPRVALCLRQAATVGALPGLPLIFCIEHRPELARWSAAFGVASALVGTLAAWLNWMISID